MTTEQAKNLSEDALLVQRFRGNLSFWISQHIQAFLPELRDKARDTH
jgi:hypothetical protein